MTLFSSNTFTRTAATTRKAAFTHKAASVVRGLLLSAAAIGPGVSNGAPLVQTVCARGYIDQYVTDALPPSNGVLVHVNMTGFIPPGLPSVAYEPWNGRDMIYMHLAGPDDTNTQWAEKRATLKMALLSRLPVRIVHYGLEVICKGTVEEFQVMVCNNDVDCNF